MTQAFIYFRTFIFPFLITKSKPVPISSCILAQVFTFYNGLLQGFYLTNIQNIETSVFTIAGKFKNTFKTIPTDPYGSVHK